MMFRTLLALLLSAAALSGGATGALACGPETDCRLGERHYRIRMPEGHDGRTPVGAILFAHGYRGSAAGIMASEALARAASDLGVALIAVKSAGEDWSIPGAPSQSAVEGADELAYVDQVIEDAAARVPLDTDRVMATGFSAGGMMVWNLICHRSGRFAAFAPVAGTFWRPIPERCTTPPASVLHIHGDDDRIVPLAGRPIADTHQGDVREALAMYAAYGGFGPARPSEIGGLACESRESATGERLDFCLFAGGHSFRAEYLTVAWRHFEATGRL